ncbi:MAG: tripartite tricarboxylate transporter TctB family protein [Azospirillaceae bacterium]
MKPSRMDKLDFVSAIVLLVFGIGVLVESLRMPRLEGLDINPYTVPGLVPGILGVAIAACGLAMLIRALIRGAWRLGLTGEAATGWLASAAVRRAVVTLLLTLVYAGVLFPLVPFVIATPIFVFAFTLTAEWMALGHRPPPRSLVIALVIAVVAGIAIGYVFQNLFFVRLPGG